MLRIYDYDQISSCQMEYSVRTEFLIPICSIDFFEFCRVWCQRFTFDVSPCDVSRGEDTVVNKGATSALHTMFLYHVSLVGVHNGDPRTTRPRVNCPPFFSLPTLVFEAIAGKIREATGTGDRWYWRPVVICWIYPLFLLFIFRFTGIAA